MFSNPEVRPLIEEAGHIYDSTVITSYLQSKLKNKHFLIAKKNAKNL